MYELLICTRDTIKKEVLVSRKAFERACDIHIRNGFSSNQDFETAHQQHYLKFIEYDIYCHLVEIFSDYKDIYGQFTAYQEMTSTLKEWMFRCAEDENYEHAAVIKLWLDKLTGIIRHNGQLIH